MKRIFILGGSGYTGRSLANHLLEQTDAHIILAARNQARSAAIASQLNDQFKGQRVSTIQVDASVPGALKDALCGVDLLIVAAPLPSTPCETVIHAALESGADYLDVQIGSKKLALLRSLASEIEKAGRCFITEAGFHPGLPSALVRYAATRLDRMDYAVTAGYLNMGNSQLPYSDSADELMELFAGFQAQVFKAGKWTRPGSVVMRKVDFKRDIGIRDTYSMFFPELSDLPQMYPSLQEVGFYLSELHWFMDYVITMLVMLGLKLFPRRGLRPMGRLMWWAMFNLPKPPYRVELRVDAGGLANGVPVKVGASIAHTDGYELTAIPVVAALLQVLDGTARKPGLWMMGHLVDPVRLMQDMEKIGAKVIVDFP